jgi:hypothetical protein
MSPTASRISKQFRKYLGSKDLNNQLCKSSEGQSRELKNPLSLLENIDNSATKQIFPTRNRYTAILY